MLNKTIIIVDPKINTLLFFVNEHRAEVIIDFSVSLIFISFSVESRFIREGINKKVINREIISPKSSSNQSQ